MEGAELFKKFLVVEEKRGLSSTSKVRINAMREVSPLDFFRIFFFIFCWPRILV